MRRVLAVASAAVVAGSLAVPFAAPPVFAEALPTWDPIEELAAPTSGLVSIPGGAGAGLATADELGGAGMEVAGEVAGVAADGAIALTPVGWALAAALATAAGGYFVYQNRAQILTAVNDVWNSLSSSTQSGLIADNQPGATVNLSATSVVSAIRTQLGTYSEPVDGIHASNTYAGVLTIPVPAGVTPSDTFDVALQQTPNIEGLDWHDWGWQFAVPRGEYTTVQWEQPYSWSGGPGCASSSSLMWCDVTLPYVSYSPGGSGLIMQMSGLSGGQDMYFDTYWTSQDTVNGNGGPPQLANGLWEPVPGVTQSWSIDVTVSIDDIPNVGSAPVPATEAVPNPTSGDATFWPGGYNPVSHQVIPAGSQVPNPVVSRQPNPLPTGEPSTGFVQWLEDLIVPNAAQVTDAVAPLEDAFGDRVPFSYVVGTLQLLPDWVDGVGSGGCAAFTVPSFGLTDPLDPGASGSSFEPSICAGSEFGGAYSVLKAAMTVILWAFLLGWGVSMFASLLRGG